MRRKYSTLVNLMLMSLTSKERPFEIYNGDLAKVKCFLNSHQLYQQWHFLLIE